MKKRRNGKGFTLVELLVTIVVLGIITAMALPLVRKLRYDQDQKKYSTYMESMEYSAKLYVDSYGDDLFQNKETSCKEITYSQLKDRKLIKDISVEDISCANNNSKVYVKKNGNDYDYYVVANCNGKEYTYGNKDVAIGCEPPTASFGYNASPPSYTKLDKKQLSINLQITSSRGFNPYTDVDYYFVDNKGNKVTDSKKLTFDIPSEESQKQEVKAGNVITAKANIVTPNNLSGSGYKLVIVTNRLLTLEGEKDSSLENDTKDFGPYTFDNTPPDIKPLLETTIKDSDPKYVYNVTDPVFTIDVSDNLVKTRSDFRICVSLDQDTCAKDSESIKNYQKLSGNDSYFGNATSKTIHVSNNYDSSKHKLYVTVVDLAGNITSKVVDYQVGQKYTIKYNANATTPKPDLSRTEDYIILNPGVERTWGQLTSPNKGSILQPTRDYYKFTGWNTSANGSGETITSSTKATKDLTVYAQWKAIDYSIKYNLNGGTVNGTNPTSFNYETQTFTVINPTRTGYNFTGWSGTGISGKTMTLKISAGSHDNRTYDANWEPITYTVEYYNGKTKLNSSSHTYDTAKALTKMSTLGGTQSGYTFYGWSDNNGTTSLTKKYSDGDSIKNLTSTDKAVIKLYAIWQRNITFYSGISNANSDTAVEYFNPYTPTYSLKLPAPKAISSWTALGWRDDTTASTSEYASGTTRTTKSSVTKYYGVYSRTVKLDYNANGGSGSVSSQTATQYYNSNGAITKISNFTLRSNSFTKNGYQFNYWAAGSTSGTHYSPGASFAFSPGVSDSATKTMYAIWKSGIYKIETTGAETQYKNTLKDAVSVATSGKSTITLLETHTEQPGGVRVNKNVNLVIPSGVTLTLQYTPASKEEGYVSAIYTTGSVTMNVSGPGTIIGAPTESSYIFRAMDSSTINFDGITIGENDMGSGQVANAIFADASSYVNINNCEIYLANRNSGTSGDSGGGVVKVGSDKKTTIKNSKIYKEGTTNALVLTFGFKNGDINIPTSGTVEVENSTIAMALSDQTSQSGCKGDSAIVLQYGTSWTLNLKDTNVIHGPARGNPVIDIFPDATSSKVNINSGTNLYHLKTSACSADPPDLVHIQNNSALVSFNNKSGQFYSYAGGVNSQSYNNRISIVSGTKFVSGTNCTYCGTRNSSYSDYTFKTIDKWGNLGTKVLNNRYYIYTK